MTPTYRIAPSLTMPVAPWVDARWPRFPDGSPIRCPVCRSYDLDDACCDQEDRRHWPYSYDPPVLCNDCQAEGRDPFVIVRTNGVYVATLGEAGEVSEARERQP